MSRLLIVAAALFAFTFSAAPASASRHHAGTSATTLTAKKTKHKKHEAKPKHHKPGKSAKK